MKIFEFNYGGKDWIFAPNIDEAKEFYTGYSGDSDFEDIEIKEIPESKWGEFKIIDTDDMEPDEDEYNDEEYSSGFKIVESFAEYAKGNEVTDIIATTEY